MDSMDEEQAAAARRRALVSLALIIGAMLLIPAFLYSLAPEEPLKEGVTVFANGRHRAYLLDPEAYRALGYTGYCVLEPHDPLIVVKPAGEAAGASMVARIEGKTKAEFPFCPPAARVLVKPHQVIQKEGLWSDLKERLRGFFSRS
ncbi:hypothetical protein [Candidatus Nitrospira bockiana]